MVGTLEILLGRDVLRELFQRPDDRARAVLRLVLAPVEMNRPIFTTPDAPGERVEALRRAFDRTMLDAEFQAEVEKSRIERIPLPGEGLQKLVEEVGGLSPEVAAKVKAIYGQGG